MPLSPGDKLGPYEILAPLGAGGMGEVYRARDTTLKREVALKVLPATFLGDPERMARFQREAEVLAALDHPNIGHILGIVDFANSRALVLALIEGPTLSDRIAAGPLPLDEAIAVSQQIIDALEYAHDRGVVHRDLKPANVKITPEGVVKVLDFGLAKVLEDEPPILSLANSPTLTMGHTRAGVILGTAAYMSPEQALGRPVDRRSDIFSFGSVLYELLTGKRTFTGASTPDVLEAVVKSDPDWSALPKGTPGYLRRLLERTLVKDRKQRLQAIGEARIALDKPDGMEVSLQSEARTTAKLPWVMTVAAVVFALALTWIHFREEPPVAELTRFQIPLPAGESFPLPLAPLEVSPDGRKLAFVTANAGGIPHVWIRSLDSLDARLLPIEISVDPEPFFWSYDSHFLAFWSSDHKLKKVDVSGGPAQTLCDAPNFFGGSWNRDGVILFVDFAHVMRVSAAGGTPTLVTAVDPARQERAHLFPKFLPDGRHFLYMRLSNTPANTGIYVGSIDAQPSQQSSKPLVVNGAYPEYYVPSENSNTLNSNNGYLLFYHDETVLAQAFNPKKLELSGDPLPLVEETGGTQGIGGFFSASDTGVLVYVGEKGIFGGKSQLTWFDREGKNLGTVWEPGILGSGALSPDGKQIAVSRREAQPGSASKTSLWLLDLTRGGASTPFTFANSTNDNPVWSPDGSRIVFSSTRDGAPSLFQKLASGVKNEEPLLNVQQALKPTSWSRDGRFLLYTAQGNAKSDLWILPMEGSKREPLLFQGTEFNESAAQFSPDGRWIAYQSDESGRDEVYVREFSLGSDGKPEATAKHQVSNGGGIGPYWTGDGRELIYEALDQRTLMSAEIAIKPSFQSSPAKALGQLPAGVTVVTITADGKRVLASVPVGQSGPQQFTVVLNWQAGLKK